MMLLRINLEYSVVLSLVIFFFFDFSFYTCKLGKYGQRLPEGKGRINLESEYKILF